MTSTSPGENKQVVEQLWRELYAGDFDAVAARLRVTSANGSHLAMS